MEHAQETLVLEAVGDNRQRWDVKEV